MYIFPLLFLSPSLSQLGAYARWFIKFVTSGWAIFDTFVVRVARARTHTEVHTHRLARARTQGARTHRRARTQTRAHTPTQTRAQTNRRVRARAHTQRQARTPARSHVCIHNHTHSLCPPLLPFPHTNKCAHPHPPAPASASARMSRFVPCRFLGQSGGEKDRQTDRQTDREEIDAWILSRNGGGG